MAKTFTETRYGVTYDYQTINGKIHPCFRSRKDFETYFKNKTGIVPPIAENWRHAEKGEWVQGDDSHAGILQILSRKKNFKHPRDKKGKELHPNGWSRTICSSQKNDDNVTLNTKLGSVENRYTLSGKYTLPLPDRIRKRNHLTIKEKQWVFACAQTDMSYESLVKAYKIICGDVAYTKRHRGVEHVVDALLEKPLVMETLIQTLQKKVEKAGVNVQMVIDGYAELALEARREDVRLNSYDRLAQLVALPAMIEKKRQDVMEQGSLTEVSFSDNTDILGEVSIDQLRGGKLVKVDKEKIEDANIKDVVSVNGVEKQKKTKTKSEISEDVTGQEHTIIKKETIDLSKYGV